jgi:hypothetical protein
MKPIEKNLNYLFKRYFNMFDFKAGVVIPAFFVALDVKTGHEAGVNACTDRFHVLMPPMRWPEDMLLTVIPNGCPQIFD